jgi:uncharacterized OsmC-like protein
MAETQVGTLPALHVASRRIGSARTTTKCKEQVNYKYRQKITTTPEIKETVLNGVNVTRLGQTIEAIQQKPELAQFKFRTHNRWDLGTHNVATISDFYGTCQELEHKAPFMLGADEPPVLLGGDTGPGAGEYVLAGLSACLTGTLAYHASARGLKLESVESDYEGDVDLRGFLDLDPEVRNGYREIRVKFRVKGDLDEATVRELLSKSPIYDTLAHPVRIKIDVETV